VAFVEKAEVFGNSRSIHTCEAGADLVPDAMMRTSIGAETLRIGETAWERSDHGWRGKLKWPVALMRKPSGGQIGAQQARNLRPVCTAIESDRANITALSG
jgi:hypothetical protein